jgi:cytochrome c oxidase subunit II
MTSWIAASVQGVSGLADPEGSFWLPPDASVFGEVDFWFNFMMWMSYIVSGLIFAVMVYFVIKYRATSRAANEKAESQLDHSDSLEIVWSIIPLVVVVFLFVGGFKGMVKMTTPPRDSYEIYVSAARWSWDFKYQNGYSDSELHVPKGKNVRLIISSQDVIHSLFIPAFRQKMDAVPGRYSELWFRATEEGTFQIFCTEYCGKDHSLMLSKATVHEPAEFDAWLEEAQEEMEALLLENPVEAGKDIYNQRCKTCHTIDGSANTGPTFKGVYGKMETLDDGQSVKVDENYIRESILDPALRTVKGYNASAMPSFKGTLSDNQITALIEFIKTVK